MGVDMPKIPQLLKNLYVQFVFSSPKFWISNEKRLHWASVVRDRAHKKCFYPSKNSTTRMIYSENTYVQLMSSVNFPVLCATIGPATKTIWRNTLKTSIAVPKAAIMHLQPLCNNSLRQGSL